MNTKEELLANHPQPDSQTAPEAEESVLPAKLSDTQASSTRADRRLSTNVVSRLMASRQGVTGARLEHWKGLLPVIEQHEKAYLELNQRELK
ncbi:MAG: hypothetical protein MKZ94_16760, partial [Pirellulales bacterium]|nr:hypothetical protein [Pirellulales bacterium]